jgi:hypothetical protein
MAADTSWLCDSTLYSTLVSVIREKVGWGSDSSMAGAYLPRRLAGAAAAAIGSISARNAAAIIIARLPCTEERLRNGPTTRPAALVISRLGLLRLPCKTSGLPTSQRDMLRP